MNCGAAFLDGSRIRADTLVRHVEVFDTLGSTNDRAGQLAREQSLALPALIAARIQTAGRGRGRNTWWATDGALTFSVLLEPAAQGISTARWPQVSLATATAVCNAIAHATGRAELDPGHGPNASADDAGRKTQDPNATLETAQNPLLGIKWPNDVLIDGRKVCGILVESPGRGAPADERMIIGVGVNVNNSWRGAPPEAGPDGTALCDVTGRQHELEELLVDVLSALANRLDQLGAEDERLPKMWQKVDLLADRQVVVEASGRLTRGVCTGIASDGALLLDTDRGPRRLYSGTVVAVG